MTYATHTEETTAFYADMGKYFAHRSYAHEMGGWQFYTKPGSIWFLAKSKGVVVGFCSAINEGKYWLFDNFYVEKGYRGQGIASELHKIRCEVVFKTGKEIRVISNNPIQFKKYEQYGFIYYGNRGRYKKYKWNPDQDANPDSDALSYSKSLEPQHGQ